MADENIIYKDLIEVLLCSNTFEALGDFHDRGLLKHDSNQAVLQTGLAWLRYVSSMRKEERASHPEFMPKATRLRENFKTEVAVHLAQVTEEALQEYEAKAAIKDLLPEELN